MHASRGAGEAGGLVLIEEGWGFAVVAELTRRRHRLAPVDGLERSAFGGGQIMQRNPGTGVLIESSDPRKNGGAVGW